jgi:hypothetical protein
VNQQAPPQQQEYPQPQWGQRGQYPQGQGYPTGPSYRQSAPAPAQLTVRPGTFITVRINQMLSSDRNKEGDGFSGVLERPLVVDGVVVAEPGEMIAGRVAEAHHSKMGDAGRLGIQLTEMTLVDGQQAPLTTQLVDRKAGGFNSQNAGTVVGTTAVGAAVGGIADWGRGAAIGAGVGLVTGVLVTQHHASVLYPEQVLVFRIDQPLTISTERTAQAFHYVQPGEYDRAPLPQPRPAYASAPPPYYYYGAYPYAYPYPYSYWGYPYWGTGVGFYFGPGYYHRGFHGGGRFRR